MPTFAPKTAPAAVRVAASKPVGAPAPVLSAEPGMMTDEAAGGLDLSRIPVLPMQRKPSISSPGDAFEREADDVADKVMRMAEPASINAQPNAIQRKCAKCEDEDKKPIQTQRTTATNAEATLDTGAAVRAAVRGGISLSKEVRSYFEPRFGHDFSQVRVHADGDAANAARGVQARAYTLGRDIVFGAGEYAPFTVSGKRLLAHELAHVIQQRNGPTIVQRRADNCPDAPPDPPIVKTMTDFIALVQRVEASTSTGSDPIATARLISRTKYDGRAWDWLLPSTKGKSGVKQTRFKAGEVDEKSQRACVGSTGQVTADDVGSLCFKLIVTMPGGGQADPMHIIAAIVADAETLAAGTGATGLSRLVDALPASVSQRGASTWVGDVGKAAAEWMTVHPLPKGGSTKGGSTKDDYMREDAPPHDLMANVDGVAITSKSAASGFAFDKSKKLSENLQAYFTPAAHKGRERRFHIFCNVEGFALEADGVTLTAKAKVAIGLQVHDFADWYSRNDPHLLAWVTAQGKNWRMSSEWVNRAGDWQWFADQFIAFVQKNLSAEGS